MLTLISGRRGQTVAGLVLSVGLIATSSACSMLDRSAQTAGYCAILSDASGLYRGNPVTRKGVPIGRIDRVIADTMSVRVDFSLNSDVAVPAQVNVISRAPSILADRGLELVNGDLSAGHLAPEACIPLDRTVSTKTISENMSAMTRMLSTMADKGRADALNRLVGSLSDQLQGKGADIRASVANLAEALDMRPSSSGPMVEDVSRVLDLLNANTDISNAALDHALSVISLAARTLMPFLYGVFGPQITPLTRLAYDLSTEYRGEVWSALDTGTETLRLLSEHTGVFVTYSGTLPNIVDGVRSFWARVRLQDVPVQAPRVDAGPQDNGMVCSRIALDGEDHCGYFYGVPDGITTIDVLQKVLKEGNPP